MLPTLRPRPVIPPGAWIGGAGWALDWPDPVGTPRQAAG